MSRLLRYTILSLALGCIAGCTNNGVQPRIIEIKNSSPLGEARGLLEGYAQGNRLSSEVDSYSELVERIREQDPEQAVIVEKALGQIKDAPHNRVTTARAALKQLENQDADQSPD